MTAKTMDLLNLPLQRLTGANVNRDTVTDVTRAGIALIDMLSRLGLVKLIRSRVPENRVREERSGNVARL